MTSPPVPDEVEMLRRAAHRPNYGVVTCESAAVPYALLKGSPRIVSRLNLLPSGSNAGTCYVGGSNLTGSTGSGGYPLPKTQTTPLVLEDVTLGEVYVLAASAGDSVAWIAGGERVH